MWRCYVVRRERRLSWNQKETADRKLGEYEQFESKMLEKAAHNGLGELIEFDEETRRFRVKKEAEENLFYHECYEEFRNESFWDGLHRTPRG